MSAIFIEGELADRLDVFFELQAEVDAARTRAENARNRAADLQAEWRRATAEADERQAEFEQAHKMLVDTRQSIGLAVQKEVLGGRYVRSTKSGESNDAG